MTRLAIHGGTPACQPAVDPVALRPLRFGEQERRALMAVVDYGVLCRTFGREADIYEKEAAAYFGAAQAVASSSGTASIHAALAAVGAGWGDEVITSPITDMGSVIGIIAQGALPVFADIDPGTFNTLPEAVERAVTPRTRAILTVHLAGLACDMPSICRIAADRGLAVVEDCAQSWLADIEGRRVGTFGNIGCFSTNGYKHISTGDGGLAVTDDPELARRMRLFTDKAYDRSAGTRNPEVFGMNYRITELQAAVGRVQLGKLKNIVARRRELASLLQQNLAGTPGLLLPVVPHGYGHSWWYFVLRREPELIETPAAEIARALAAEGIPAWTGYCGGRPVYLYDCFQHPEKSFFRLPPLAGDQKLSALYPAGLCPNAEKLLDEMIIVSMSEHYTERNARQMAEGIAKVFEWYGKG